MMSVEPATNICAVRFDDGVLDGDFASPHSDTATPTCTLVGADCHLRERYVPCSDVNASPTLFRLRKAAIYNQPDNMNHIAR